MTMNQHTHVNNKANTNIKNDSISTTISQYDTSANDLPQSVNMDQHDHGSSTLRLYTVD